MRIAICDDEVNEHKIMHEFFNNYPLKLPELEIVDYYQGKEMLADEKGFDIVFMDIELTDCNGVELAGKIKENFPTAKIIFFSNYPKYVTQSYYIDTFQFLLKPLSQEIFNKELSRALEYIKRSSEKIVRKAKEGNIVLKKADIVYLESQRRVLIVYLQDGSRYQYYGRLAAEEKELGQDNFVRCHKSFIVNLDFVRSFDYKFVVTTVKNINNNSACEKTPDYIKIPVGSIYYSGFKEKFLKYLAK